MGTRDYDRLPIEEFGRHLITTGDLDPVYIALFGAGFEEAALHRWLVAYWCFYHCGLASWIADEPERFWNRMETAALNQEPAPPGGRFPRASERRHFRGEQATRAVGELREKYLVPGATGMIDAITGQRHEGLVVPFKELVGRVRTHRGFGDWIAFKVGDMLDRLGIVFVEFNQSEVFMYRDPAKAALMLWQKQTGSDEPPRNRVEAIAQVVAYLNTTFQDLTAPPMHERPVGLQEVETVLCKWKSHLNGHYPLWKDTDEINGGLREWAEHSSMARQFAEAMPRREDQQA